MTYPWRVHTGPRSAEDADWIRQGAAYRLDYVRSGRPNTGRSLSGHIHALPRSGFAIVEDEVARSSRLGTWPADTRLEDSLAPLSFHFQDERRERCSRVDRFLTFGIFAP